MTQTVLWIGTAAAELAATDEYSKDLLAQMRDGIPTTVNGALLRAIRINGCLAGYGCRVRVWPGTQSLALNTENTDPILATTKKAMQRCGFAGPVSLFLEVDEAAP